jgi:GNAT superfamily N-acetyltransferase
VNHSLLLVPGSNVTRVTAQEHQATSVRLLADLPPLVKAVALMRWREWGDEIGREHPGWWIEATRRAAGQGALPVSWVAVDEGGSLLGAVGLGQFDIDERRDRSPWVLGMIVHPAHRRRGVGRMLLSELEVFAASDGHPRVWAATGDPGREFYTRCGWTFVERLIRRDDSQRVNVLVKELAPTHPRRAREPSS